MPIISVPTTIPPSPGPTPVVQPDGIPPTTQVLVAPYCTESDVPVGLYTDSNGRVITDVPLGLAICAATEVLFNKTRQKYRSGRTVARPTRIVNTFGAQSFLYPYSSMSGYGSAWGFGDSWTWSSLGGGWWQYTQDLAEVVLQAPVTRINQVMVDGAVLDPANYTLYNQRRLVRNIDAAGTNGGAWPWNQSTQLPLSEAGTWSIDYEWGRPTPSMGKMACAELAAELMKALSGQDPSKLPSQVQSFASQGVNIAIGHAVDYLTANLTGLPICDAWIKAENPIGSRHRPVILSPNDVVRRTT